MRDVGGLMLELLADGARLQNMSRAARTVARPEAAAAVARAFLVLPRRGMGKKRDMKRNISKIHMIGIGGSGMSGIAEVLLNMGYSVSGSDVTDSAAVQRLRGLGADIRLGHAAENVGDVSVVVKSSAVGEGNPEVLAARTKACRSSPG